jgi:hypothetical protein
MLYAYAGKRYIFLMFVAMAIFFSQGTLIAGDIILNRTGNIKITKPDGAVLTVGKDESLPDIPSGSTVVILDGIIEVSPTTGFIKIVVGDSMATVKAGDKVTAKADSVTGMADFKVDAGQVSIITGNTTSIVKANQQALIGLDRKTGIVEIRSIKGTIETTTVGVKAAIPQDGIAKINADAKTRNIHIEAVKGKIIIISIDGELNEVAEGKSIDTAGSAVGEIQTFEEIEIPSVPEEEPAEPERPEASPHRP